MKNSWLIWIFIVGVVVTIFFAFNQKKDVPFNDIFPEDETGPVDIEYEFVPKNQTVSERSPSQDALEETETISSLQERQQEQVIEIEEVTNQPDPQQASTDSEENSSKTETVAIDDFQYTIQVASFKKKERAEKLKNELGEKDYEAFILSKDLKDAGVWHRVYVGRYDNKKEAQPTLKEIKKEYNNSFIIAPK
jgi:cell division septation protein DedD